MILAMVPEFLMKRINGIGKVILQIPITEHFRSFEYGNIHYTARNKKLKALKTTNSNTEEILYPDTYPSEIEISAIQMEVVQSRECYVDKKRLSYSFSSKIQQIKQFGEYGFPIIQIDQICTLLDNPYMTITNFNLSSYTNLLFILPHGAHIELKDTGIIYTPIKSLSILDSQEGF